MGVSGLVGHCIIVDDFRWYGNDLMGPEYKVGVLGGRSWIRWILAKTNPNPITNPNCIPSRKIVELGF